MSLYLGGVISLLTADEMLAMLPIKTLSNFSRNDIWILRICNSQLSYRLYSEAKVLLGQLPDEELSSN